jgi:hypothetical protein
MSSLGKHPMALALEKYLSKENIMTYKLEGRLTDFCSCNVVCPCWVGEDPDGGVCEGAVTWHIDSGTINGIDVSGLTIALLADLPGNALEGNWRVAAYVSDTATAEQTQAIADVWTGKLGGPVADLAALVGEVAGLEQAPISFDVVKGKGSLVVGDVFEATMEPLRGAQGEVVTLGDNVFASISGAQTYLGKSTKLRRKATKGFKALNLEGHAATMNNFRYES